MKQIFDAIRAQLAHKPRGYSYSTDTLRNLAFLERRLRGFSHRLDTLCGLARLSESDVKLQANLRQALLLTLGFLAQDKSWWAEACAAGAEADSEKTPPEIRAILKLHEKSGQLRVAAAQLLRKPQQLKVLAPLRGQFTAQADSLVYSNGTLTFTCSIRFYDPTTGGTSNLTAESCRLENIDPDSLGGAADALREMRKALLRQIEDAQSSPAFLQEQAAREAAKKEDTERAERIRKVLSGLTPADRQYLRDRVSTSSNPFFAALFN